MMRRSRRWNVPEALQASAMDCGPAALQSLLAGYRISISLARLREQCQTSLDGTSIDVLEDIARDSGLPVEQIIVGERQIVEDPELLPAIAIVQRPDGNIHFLVLWRRVGPWIQVMDPGRGRSWRRVQEVIDELFKFEHEVDAEDFAEFAKSLVFQRPILARARALGATEGVRARLHEATLRDNWQQLALIDAATRFAHSVLIAGGISRGAHARRFLTAVARAAADGWPAARRVIPARHWFAVVDAASSCTVRIRGTVLLRAAMRHSRRCPEVRGEVERSSIGVRGPSPWGVLVSSLARGAPVVTVALVLGTAVAASHRVVEALLFNAVFSLGGSLGTTGGRLGMLIALVAFVITSVILELPLNRALQRIGRSLERAFRSAVLVVLPRLSERYFGSRLQSDLAARAHSIHMLRGAPLLLAGVGHTLASLTVTVVGTAMLDRRAGALAGVAAVAILVLQLLALQPMAERDLRFRTQTAALGRFYYDTLLGLRALRASGGQRALEHEYDQVLHHWRAGGLSRARVAVAADAIGLVTSLGVGAWLVFDYVGRVGSSAHALLLLYWLLRLPGLGRQLGMQLRSLPAIGNVAARLIEPLGAYEPAPPSAADQVVPPVAEEGMGVELSLEQVDVVAGGHEVLRDVSVTVPAGQSVAVIGASGAGKSTLLRLALGLQRASAGLIRVDGEPLCEAVLDALRSRTAWIDPDVALWNRSLADNIAYGNERTAWDGRVISDALLEDVVAASFDGLQRRLGEEGRRISGGEGQRVRVARALLRAHPELVVMDEPFRGLGREQRRSLMRRLLQRFGGRTILCATHDVSEALLFDRVLVVSAGRVVEDGVPQALASDAHSRLAAMLADERRAQATAWGRRPWRRFRLEHGRLVSGAADA